MCFSPCKATFNSLQERFYNRFIPCSHRVTSLNTHHTEALLPVKNSLKYYKFSSIFFPLWYVHSYVLNFLNNHAIEEKALLYWDIFPLGTLCVAILATCTLPRKCIMYVPKRLWNKKGILQVHLSIHPL